MAKTIKGRDIIEDNHLANAIEDVKTYMALIQDLDKVVLKLKTDIKGLGQTGNATTVTEIKAVSDAYKKSNEAVNAAIILDKQLRDAQDEVVKGKIRMQQVTATQKKLLTEEIALEDKQIGTLKRLNIENARLRREREGLNLATKAGTDRMKEINIQLDRNNKIIRDSADAQKKQTLNVGNYQSALKGLHSTLSQLGLAFSAFTVAQDVFKTVVDFEKATASLSAITGATGNQLEDLKGKVMDLSETMKISATDATKLFEIVGSQMPQLLQDAEGLKTVAESAVTLSKASGDSVEESTRALANVMNQFSLGADQAQRTMNILAAGSLVGSAGINDVSESMKNFGSVAAGANISVEESVALIEVLGKFGLVGAEAGTKLRGSVLKLQQANFGYASGQFEINDALEEARKKMESLGSEMERDAFLQKTFGAENISTGRILLNNIGLFDEYTKGVTGTNVATDQAATNSNTMATVIKELGAAWDNWVIGMSEGTDVLDTLKDILRFVAENLGTIMEWVGRAVIAWGSYRAALLLVNKEGTGFIQVLGRMGAALKSSGGAAASFAKSIKSVGFAGWIGALTVIVPMLWDAGKALYEMFNRTTALERVTEKFNERMDEERAKMDLLKIRVLDALGNKAKMKGLIDEINETYGTTIKNIEDEALMLYQLEKAYKAVNAEMENRIMQQLIEEELTAGFKARRELEKAISETEDTWFDTDQLDLYKKALGEVNKDIAELQGELFDMNETGPVGTGKSLTGRVANRDRGLKDQVVSDRKETSREVEKIEKEEIKRLENNSIEKIDIARETFEHQEYFMVDAMVDANNRIAEEERKAAELRRKNALETIELIKKITDAMAEEIDRRIALEQNELAASKDKIDYLQEQAKLGNTDAAESIKAETIAMANQTLEIERLEKKKSNLLLTVTALELASQKINNGDSNAIQNASTSIADFIAKLPKFYEGTEGTVAEALGRPHLPGKDGYIARVHKNEMIIGAEKSAQLQAAGFNTTSDVAKAALAYSSAVVSGRAPQLNGEYMVVEKLDSVEKAIKDIDIPQPDFYYNEYTKIATEVIRTRDKTIRNHQKIGGLFS